MRFSQSLHVQLSHPVISTASTEIERKAFEAQQNRRRLAAYYQKRCELSKNNSVHLPMKHVHLFPHGRVIGRN